MIFARRQIQKALSELTFLPPNEVRGLAARLNKAEPDALAAMWEVLLLRHFSTLGFVEHHRATPNGSQPDIHFRNKVLTFTADITCVSDEGLQRENPYQLLQDEIEKQKRKLGLGIGGLYLDIGHHEGDRKVKLKLPAASDIPAFVENEVVPAIAEAQSRREWPIFLQWQTAEIEFQLTIKDGPYSGGAHRAFDAPKTLKSNPIYGRLRGKTAQVSGGEGLRGIILCDSGYAAFRENPVDGQRVDARKIAHAFLRTCDQVDFVALFWVSEDIGWSRVAHREVRCDLIRKSNDPALQAVFKACADKLPRPLRTGQNALNLIRWFGKDLGFGGGMSLRWPKVRLSSKMLMNLLSGRISIEEFNERLDWRGRGNAERDHFLNVFERALQEGRLPKLITIESVSDQDDDWIEFEFGSADAAAAPFTAPEV